jgi:hypothetical protein
MADEPTPPDRPDDDWEAAGDLVHHNTKFEPDTPDWDRAQTAVLAGIQHGREVERKAIEADLTRAVGEYEARLARARRAHDDCREAVEHEYGRRLQAEAERDRLRKVADAAIHNETEIRKHLRCRIEAADAAHRERDALAAECRHALLACLGFIGGVSVLDRAGIEATIKRALAMPGMPPIGGVEVDRIDRTTQQERSETDERS